jgi:phosphatidylserine decarboxylase
MDLSGSRKKIRAFIKKYDIDLDEIELPLNQYKNLNAFFSRKLKPDARPFIADPHPFCSPADGKVLAYPKLDAQTRLPVKGSHVDIIDLLSSRESAIPYRDGAALVIRLAPSDYHRYHFPVAGIATASAQISGRYYLVNPIALDVKPDLFAHNKREITHLETEHFGRIMIMEVAGWGVGRIVQTYQPGSVKRGQEKGYFQFGGSTLVLLFEPGRIIFDDDLIRDTQSGIEVQVHTGSQLGVQTVS